MKPKCSVLISSHNRLPLFRRCLWSIATRPPSVPFEVVVADDGSDEDILGLLREFSPRFPWKFVRVGVAAFESATGLKRFHNNPALTNNVAFRHSRGDLVFLMGNEVIATADAFDRLLAAGEKAGTDRWLAFSTTYDLGQEWLDRLDDYGSNLSRHMVGRASERPLQSEGYRSDVTNYLSLCPRTLWEGLGGYDERYLAGISSDDSDFVRRARAAGAAASVVADAVTLHQYHGGQTCYYEQQSMSRARWQDGVDINHAVYHAWDGGHRNPQPFPWGTFGVGEVVSNLDAPSNPFSQEE